MNFKKNKTNSIKLKATVPAKKNYNTSSVNSYRLAPTASTKLKKNSSETGLLKTKITNLEQNLNDQEKILKTLMNKINIEETVRPKEKTSNYYFFF